MANEMFTPPTIPAPLATGARAAGPRDGACALCSVRLWPGQRIADLVAGGRAHVSCVAATGGRAR